MNSLSRVLDFGEEQMAIQKAMGKTKKTALLAHAPKGACFEVCDGPILKSLKDLHDFFDDMTKEQFEYHTKRNGNDFACWIGDVFEQQELATKISKLKSKRGVKNAIERALKK